MLPSKATQYVVVRLPLSTTSAACGAPPASAAHAAPAPATAGPIVGSVRTSATANERRRGTVIRLDRG